MIKQNHFFGWRRYLNQAEDSNYSMSGKFDPQCTHMSLYNIYESLLKLVVNCKFSTSLVALIGESSPTVDIYTFAPQLVDSTEVSKTTSVNMRETNQSWDKTKLT